MTEETPEQIRLREAAAYRAEAEAKSAVDKRFGSPYEEDNVINKETFEAPYGVDSYTVSIRTYDDAPEEKFIYFECDGDDYYSIGIAKREEIDQLINILIRARDHAFPLEETTNAT